MVSITNAGSLIRLPAITAYVPDNLLSSAAYASNHTLVAQSTPYFVHRGCAVGLVSTFRKMQGLARNHCAHLLSFFLNGIRSSSFGVVSAEVPTFEHDSQEHVKEAKRRQK